MPTYYARQDAGTDIENLSQKPPKMASLMANKAIAISQQLP